MPEKYTIQEHAMEEKETCQYCAGQRRDPMSDGENWLPCPACNGTGFVVNIAPSWDAAAHRPGKTA